jgi:hypothetical protein
MDDGLPTLDEFLKRGLRFPRNAYVREPGFASLYVRWGGHLIGGRIVNCLDLANATAYEPGKGAFKRLVARLRGEHPDLPLYAENVLNERLIPGLLHLGFRYVTDSHPPSFILSEGT